MPGPTAEAFWTLALIVGRVAADAGVVQGREGRSGEVALVGLQNGVGQGFLGLMIPVGRQRDGGLVGHQPQQLAAQGLHVVAAVGVAGLVARLRVRILRIHDEGRGRFRGTGRIGNDALITAAILRGGGDGGEQYVLDDRQVGREAEVTAIQAAAGDLGGEFLFIARRVSDDADGTTFGVGAEQRALRTFQDFDAVHVQQALIGADGARQVHAIQVDAHRGVQVEGEIILSHAANRGGEHRAVARERRAGIQVHAWGEIAERADVDQVALLQ